MAKDRSLACCIRPQESYVLRTVELMCSDTQDLQFLCLLRSAVLWVTGWSPICGKSTIPGKLFRAGLIGVLDLLSFLECYNIRRTKLPVEGQ